ncbi:MAG: ABC transporter ATP-binding protein [Oligoflexales bacterium]|nr:ABC transporter ATP-binding protein [Oligoflexales bacterium]
MITIQNIKKSFGSIEALVDVSFIVKKGQVVGFLGANGAGKTTTMDIVCGCIGADFGSVSIDGYDVFDKPKEEKKKIGYLPEDPPIHDDMVVKEYLFYVARLRGVPIKDADLRVGQAIDRLSIGEVKDRLIGNLSKGYRQRVGLAQALVHNPEVLIFDEPTEGLDPGQIVQIRELIKALREDHTILFSSHILSEVQTVCDHIVIIDKGRIVEQGSYEELITKIEGGKQYLLKVARDPETLVKELADIEGVVRPRIVDLEKRSIEFISVDDEKVVDRVISHIVNNNFGIREMVLKSKSLEEVFFQLTRSK